MAERNGDVEKVAAGDVVRTARRAMRDLEVGRARARFVRERVVAMMVVVRKVVARRKRKWKFIEGGECGNIDSRLF